jgi:hypothetical protein
METALVDLVTLSVLAIVVTEVMAATEEEEGVEVTVQVVVAAT